MGLAALADPGRQGGVVGSLVGLDDIRPIGHPLGIEPQVRKDLGNHFTGPLLEDGIPEHQQSSLLQGPSVAFQLGRIVPGGEVASSPFRSRTGEFLINGLLERPMLHQMLSAGMSSKIAEHVPGGEGPIHGVSKHGHQQGLPEAREAIAAQQRARGAVNASADRVFIGNGVSELIDMSLRALLNPGDEVLLPSPDYPLWTAATLLNDGVAEHYPCEASNGFLPDPAQIESQITQRTRALVLINPNNPTGAVYPKALLEELVAVAARHRLLLMVDEIYDSIVYDDTPFQPLAQLAGDLPCLTFGGLSKVHRACGYRVGWVSLSGDVAQMRDYHHALDLLGALRLCANVPGQWAIPAALEGEDTITPLCQPGGRLPSVQR